MSNNEINYSAEATAVTVAESAARGAAAAMSTEAMQSTAGRHNDEQSSATRNDSAAKSGFPSADSLLQNLGGRDEAGRGSINGLDQRPGGCIPQPKEEGTSKGDLIKQGQIQDRGHSGINEGIQRSVDAKDLKPQPGEKTNKIEERPRVIECPGPGPNGRPTREYDFNQVDKKWDRLIQDLSKKVRN